MKLKHVVIGDPVEEVANTTARRCARFATQTSTATTGANFLKRVRKHKPELVFLSLELLRPEAFEVARVLRKKHPKIVVICTYRELAISTVEKLRPLKIRFFIPHPPPLAQILRVVSNQFGISARLQPRFDTQFNVYRADGVLMGKTCNMSARGILMEAVQTTQPNQSILLDLELPDASPEPLRIRCRVVETQGSSPPLTRVAFEKVLTSDRRRMPLFLRQLENSLNPE